MLIRWDSPQLAGPQGVENRYVGDADPHSSTLGPRETSCDRPEEEFDVLNTYNILLCLGFSLFIYLHVYNFHNNQPQGSAQFSV